MNSHDPIFNPINFADFYNEKKSELKLPHTFYDQVDEKVIKAMFAYLAVNPKITSLDLSGTKIPKRYRDCLSQNLADNRTLTSLNISNNSFKDVYYFNRLITFLSEMTTLTSLSMRGCDIGIDGAKVLAEYLAKNKTLTSLDISYNFIYGDGLKALDTRLAKNTTLKSLNVSHNDINDFKDPTISDKVFPSLVSNKTLTSLDISHNHLDDNYLKSLAPILALNKKLTTINISGNEITNESSLLIIAINRLHPSMKIDWGNVILKDMNDGSELKQALIQYYGGDVLKSSEVYGEGINHLVAALPAATKKGRSVLTLTNLSADSVAVVVSEMPEQELRNLSMTCSRLNEIINNLILKQYSNQLPFQMTTDVLCTIFQYVSKQEATQMMGSLSSTSKSLNSFFYDRLNLEFERKDLGSKLIALYQAVIDDDDIQVKSILTSHPFLINSSIKNFTIKSKLTLQQFISEDLLMMAVKCKQIEMIKLLLPYYDKYPITKNAALLTLSHFYKKTSYSKLSLNDKYYSKLSLNDKNDKKDFLSAIEKEIPETYKKEIQSFIDIFSTAIFPGKTVQPHVQPKVIFTGVGQDLKNFDTQPYLEKLYQLSDRAEGQLNSFYRATFSDKPVKINANIRPELLLYAFYKLCCSNFNKFNEQQLSQFCIRVGGWIQSLLPLATIKFLSSHKYTSFTNCQIDRYYRCRLPHFRSFLFGEEPTAAYPIKFTQKSLSNALKALEAYFWENEKSFFEILSNEKRKFSISNETQLENLNTPPKRLAH